MVRIKIDFNALAAVAAVGISVGVPAWFVWKSIKEEKKLKAYKEGKMTELGFDANKRIAEASITNEFIKDPKDKAFLKVSLDELYMQVVKASNTKKFEESLETFIEYTDFLTKDEENAQTYLEYLRLIEKKIVIDQEHQFELDKIGAMTRPLVDAIAYKVKWS